jgi:hypothetical protein
MLAFAAGCLAPTAVARPETVDQRWFRAKAEYLQVVEKAVAYAQSPRADLDIVRAMAQVDMVAHAVMRAGDQVMRGEAKPDREMQLGAGVIQLSALRLSMLELLNGVVERG